MSRNIRDYREGRDIGFGQGVITGGLGGVLVTVVLGIGAYAISDIVEDDRPYNVAAQLDFICRNVENSHGIASVNFDLKEGSSLRIGENTVKSLGQGEYSLKVEAEGDRAEAKDIFLESASRIKASGIEYSIKAHEGPNKSTNIEVIRSCKER